LSSAAVPAAGSEARSADEVDLALAAAVAQESSVRVILGLDIGPAFRIDGSLSFPAAAVKREAISRAQQTVIGSLAGQKFSVTATYEFIPYLALRVDDAGLDQLFDLRAAGQITRIELDGVSRPTLASSAAVIGADSAYAAGFSGGGQTVAILDTGIERAHSFFGGASSRVVSEACYSTEDPGDGAVPLCPNGQTEQTGTGSADASTDECFVGPGTSGTHLCWHGTHVAGIAAGQGSSFSGVAPAANIIAIQVFSRFNNPATCSPFSQCILAYDADIIRALERVYALRSTFPVSAVNLSLGGDRFTSPCDSTKPAIKAAVDTLRSAGIVTIASTANDSYTDAMGYPACISTVVSVGATTDADTIASFSNRASFMDFFAPGNDVESSVPGDGFFSASGTSMAAPQVAGAWTVLRSESPAASIPSIFSALTTTGVPIAFSSYAKPRIQLDAALALFAPTLTVSTAGTGSGEVESYPGDILCGSECAQVYPSGSTVELTATPFPGDAFTGWSGDADCADGAVTMSADRSCTATFELMRTLTVSPQGSGTGMVTSSPPGISCGPDCQGSYAHGSAVALAATPDMNFEFSGFGGDTDCADGLLVMDGDKACTATFSACSIDSIVDLPAQVVAASETFEACNVLRAGAGGFVIQGAGTAVGFTAANSIELQNGFSVEGGASFSATLGSP
jgi:subtilisin family serine protease